MGHPRSQRPKVQRPSPLQQVHHSRPLSQAPLDHPPEISLVRDPAFWKRFSVAVHNAEEVDSEKGLSPASSIDTKYGADWLVQQHKEKRKCRIMCVAITFAVILVIAAAAVLGWYFVDVR